MSAAAMRAVMGPAPFVFAPSEGKVEGPAFSRVFQSLATMLVAGGMGWVGRLWLRGAITYGPGCIWIVAGLVLMAWTWGSMMRSRTAITPDALEQSWIWNKRLPLNELAYCRLMRVPGLDWLIAPRLYARTLGGKFAVFYCATPRLLRECSRLSTELATFRRM